MKANLLLALLFLTVFMSNGQSRRIDSLKPLLNFSNDTLKLVYSGLLSRSWSNINSDSAIWYGQLYDSLSRQLGYELNAADALQLIATNLVGTKAFESLKKLFDAESICKQTKHPSVLPSRYLNELDVPASMHEPRKYKQYILANIYSAYVYIHWSKGNDTKAKNYISKALSLADRYNLTELKIFNYGFFGRMISDHDSAIRYLLKAEKVALENHAYNNLSFVYSSISQKYKWKRDYENEIKYLRQSYELNKKDEKPMEVGWNFRNFAIHYKQLSIYDSAYYYGYRALEQAKRGNDVELELYTSKILAEAYKSQGQKDSALMYMEHVLDIIDKVDDEVATAYFNETDYSRLVELTAAEKANAAYHTRVRYYALSAGIAVILFFALFLWRNSLRQKEQFLALQKQKAKTEQALQNLQAAQAQLIQKEKMASLGELTAGIAHEIQNPLNFINNFSEVNKELLAEMKRAIAEKDYEALNQLCDDIIQNENKINQHGDRADNIVKGMMEHSKMRSGQPEPTNVNELSEKYLRIAYHGFRAKEESSEVSIKCELDPSVGMVSLVQQDIGKVLLNLINNALYAVIEKFASGGVKEYHPEIILRTRRASSSIQISITDNGNGVSNKVIDKIFQPFFTTKPTGEGTGLGLSLSYDIVTAHGGRLTVNTKEGEGAVFTIELPA